MTPEEIQKNVSDVHGALADFKRKVSELKKNLHEVVVSYRKDLEKEKLRQIKKTLS